MFTWKADIYNIMEGHCWKYLQYRAKKLGQSRHYQDSTSCLQLFAGLSNLCFLLKQMSTWWRTCLQHQAGCKDKVLRPLTLQDSGNSCGELLFKIVASWAKDNNLSYGLVIWRNPTKAISLSTHLSMHRRTKAHNRLLPALSQLAATQDSGFAGKR